MFLGRFLDSDAVYFPPGGGFKLVELAPNVQHVVGGTANNLIVTMKDGIVIFDAPVNEGQSRWVIDAAKKKYPGKRSAIWCSPITTWTTPAACGPMWRKARP